MALIEETKGRRDNQSPSGYTRLFGIQPMGQLMSRIHGAGIKAGTELETMIWERSRQIPDLDAFIASTILPQTEANSSERLWVARKQQIKASQVIHSAYEPDFLVFDVIKRICYVVEVKDGDTFDTKKAAGEHTTLHNFTTDVASALPFSARIYLCSFNVSTKEEAYHGLKKKFSMDEILTGKEFCELIGIDYDEIVKTRTSDQQRNLEYFVKELLMINPILNMIRKFLNSIKN